MIESTAALDPIALIGGFTLVNAIFAIALAAHPERIRGRGWFGIAVAALAFLLLPLLVTVAGTRAHLQHATSTEFCLSCHEMEPYGRSLRLDDESFIPAVHTQNRWTDPETACYTCHTTYTMFGDVNAKIQGVRHLWVHYFGTIPDPIELYQPYSNRECLSCHAGARRFEANELHADERAALDAGETSCLECHDLIHAVDRLDGEPLWEPPDES